MRIEKITLRNFRGVKEATVELARGVTIIAGPNEVGKSSIAEAMRLLRTMKHSSRARSILALQPVGRDVGPEVELEFSSRDHHVWVRKQWLREAATELRISGASNEQHTGDTAHERLGTFLAESMDVELFDALEVIQGSSLNAAELVGLRSLTQALDATSAPVADHDELIERIESEYKEHLTAAGKPRGRYQQLEKQVEELRAAQEELRERSREMDRLTLDTERTQSQLASDEADLLRAQDNLATCQARDDALTGLREAVAEAKTAAENAAARVRDAATAAKAREDLVAEVARREETLREAGAAAGATEEELAALQGSGATLSKARDSARKKVDVARSDAAKASQAVTAALDAEALAQLQERLDTALAAEERRLAAAKLIANSHVSAELLEKIAARSTDVHVARSAREAASARVRIRAEGESALDVDGEELEEEAEILVTDPVVITAPGVARIEVHPGALPEDLERAVQEAEDALAAALEKGQVATVAAAREAAAQRAKAEEERNLADQAFRAAVGTESLEELREQHATLAAQCEATTPQPEQGPEAEREDPRNLAELRENAALAATAAEEAEAALEAAQKALEDHHNETARRREQHIRAESARENQAEELTRVTAALEAARSEYSDEGLAAEVAAAKEVATATEAARREAEEQLAAANPEAVDMELANAKEWMESAVERVDDTRGRLRAVIALLDDRAKQGIYDEQQETESRLRSAEREYHSLRRRAAAVRLLREVMIRHRDAAHARYVTPFAEQIERLGRIVFGADFSVEISPELAILSRTLNGQTVPFESLSAGAREQLGLLGRLACAALVDPLEGAPVILDDTLGFADDTRLKSLGAVLNDVGKDAQIIVLTCQPARFSQIGGAKVVHLQSA